MSQHHNNHQVSFKTLISVSKGFNELYEASILHDVIGADQGKLALDFLSILMDYGGIMSLIYLDMSTVLGDDFDKLLLYHPSIIDMEATLIISDEHYTQLLMLEERFKRLFSDLAQLKGLNNT